MVFFLAEEDHSGREKKDPEWGTLGLKVNLMICGPLLPFTTSRALSTCI